MIKNSAIVSEVWNTTRPLWRILFIWDFVHRPEKKIKGSLMYRILPKKVIVSESHDRQSPMVLICPSYSS
jgi:hypothetical protein